MFEIEPKDPALVEAGSPCSEERSGLLSSVQTQVIYKVPVADKELPLRIIPLAADEKDQLLRNPLAQDEDSREEQFQILPKKNCWTKRRFQVIIFFYPTLKIQFFLVDPINLIKLNPQKSVILFYK